ncbi:hypothetical protein STAFG_5387 [Streptomyces afghaniensis 772]|uniref:Uncharacterized protein n=1 Tax=Streptomyces afghaniensis 772 TaxID=1283301 RepID=S4MLN3_9ACTN|nr:hypothetical protein STAFG_5387 [Streptomyces afghaniensis 772]
MHSGRADVTTYTPSPASYGRSHAAHDGRAWQCTHQNRQRRAPGSTA